MPEMNNRRIMPGISGMKTFELLISVFEISVRFGFHKLSLRSARHDQTLIFV